MSHCDKWIAVFDFVLGIFEGMSVCWNSIYISKKKNSISTDTEKLKRLWARHDIRVPIKSVSCKYLDSCSKKYQQTIPPAYNKSLENPLNF